MTILPARAREVRATAVRLAAAKARYRAVEKLTGVPWVMIAVIHEREASQNWNTQLAQGDPLHRVSTHVPRGMGPFATWEAGAVAALKHEGFEHVIDWRLEEGPVLSRGLQRLGLLRARRAVALRLGRDEHSAAGEICRRRRVVSAHARPATRLRRAHRCDERPQCKHSATSRKGRPKTCALSVRPRESGDPGAAERSSGFPLARE
jgi:hypothetical protein